MVNDIESLDMEFRVLSVFLFLRKIYEKKIKLFFVRKKNRKGLKFFSVFLFSVFLSINRILKKGLKLFSVFFLVRRILKKELKFFSVFLLIKRIRRKGLKLFSVFFL